MPSLPVTPLPPAVIRALQHVCTATLTTVLLKKGLRNVWMRGTRPLAPGQGRRIGRAFTLRFVPAREDLATPASWASPISTRAAIEAMPPGVIAVVGALGVTDAGIFGDILCARMARREVAGLVTDGVVRDIPGVLATRSRIPSRHFMPIKPAPTISTRVFFVRQSASSCASLSVMNV